MTRRSFVACALIILVGSVVFANALRVPLLLDDTGAIATNQSIRSFKEALSPPPDTTVAGRPVANLSFALDFALAPGSVEALHVTNILIHLLAALLLFGLVRRLQKSEVTAAIITLLWMVHPIQTQAVTYLCQRVESLMGLFALLTLYAVVRYVESGRRGWMLLAILACGLGMGTKEVMAGVPLLAILLDRAFLAPSWRELWTRRRSLYLALAGTWVVLLLLVITHPRSLSAGSSNLLRPLEYLRMQCIVVTAYLVLIFRRQPLVFDYGDSATSIPIPMRTSEWLPGAMVLGTLALLSTYAWWRGRRDVGFLGAWFFILLAPSSSVVPVITEAAAEHRLYLPLIAPIALTVGVAAAVLRKLSSWWVLLPIGAAAFIVGVLGRETILRNATLATPLSLWEQNAIDWPSSSRVLLHFGMAAEDAGQHRRAEQLFERAIAADPHETWARYHLAQELERRGAYAEAAVQFGACLHQISVPGLVEFQVANSLAAQGRLEEALLLYRQAISADQDHWEYQSRAMAVASRAGHADARPALERIVHEVPDFPGGHVDRADALAQDGHDDEAVTELSEALRLDPADTDAWRKLGLVKLEMGHVVQAQRCFERAVLVDPEGMLANEALAWMLANNGERVRARERLAAAGLDLFHPWRVALVQAAIEGLPVAASVLTPTSTRELFWQ